MAGDTMSDGEASELAGRPLVNPLLESFADRYLYAWDQRELGRIDSPLYLVPQLNDAAELFERGRQRWRTFDQLGAPREERGATVRDFEGKEWTASNLDTAREAHRFLYTHTRFDLSKPDELYLPELGMHIPGKAPAHVLYASVAMRCAQDAAAECYSLSRTIEGYARRALGVDLAALHESDNDAWIDRVRDARRDLADEVAESRVFIETSLGAARTALALATAAENDANLDAAERDFVALWRQYEVDKQAAVGPGPASPAHPYFTLPQVDELDELKPSSEIAALVAAKEASIKLRAEQEEIRAAGRRANAERAEGTREDVRKMWFECSEKHPAWSTAEVCHWIAEQLVSPLADVKSMKKGDQPRRMTKSAVEKMVRVMKRAGQLVRKVGQPSQETERETIRPK